MTLEPGLTVFIPVYNEEELLVANIRRLLEFLEALEVPYEVLVGSNGSTDRTVSLLGRLCDAEQAVRYFHLPSRGVGTAFREAVAKASYERIVTVDMDLSISLEFIPEAYELLEHHDMVIGSKITGTQKRSWLRMAASTAFISLAKYLLRINFHDYSIAAKGYRRDMAQRYLPHTDDLTFYVVEIVYRAHRDGRRLTEVPVQCHDMRGSRFNLIHEGVYKFGNLFLLWLRSLRG